MTQSRRSNRRALIKKYLIDNEGKVIQHELKKFLEQEGIGCVQATISKDLKEMGYKKVNGQWHKDDSAVKNETKEILRRLLAYDVPIMRNTETFSLFLKTRTRNEDAICDLIYEVYKDDILGAFAGNGCVMVVCGNKNRMIKITKELLPYRHEEVMMVQHKRKRRKTNDQDLEETE